MVFMAQLMKDALYMKQAFGCIMVVLNTQPSSFEIREFVLTYFSSCIHEYIELIQTKAIKVFKPLEFNIEELELKMRRQRKQKLMLPRHDKNKLNNLLGTYDPSLPLSAMNLISDRQELLVGKYST